jgi:phosphoribosylanthranilate isomerase
MMAKSPGILLSPGRVVQIAGIADADEARMLVSCGVDFIGFPLGPGRVEGDVDEKDAGRIVRGLRPPVYGVLITYSTSAAAISTLCRQLSFSVVQLHGGIDVGEVRRLRELSPELFVVKTLVVRGADHAALLEDVDRYEAHVDAFLADTFDEATGRRGATGKTHDWSVSRRVVERSGRPVLLAGGLNPENVRRAIAEVGPAGVDVHTGVEDAAGRKDRRLVQSFVECARKAFSSL